MIIRGVEWFASSGALYNVLDAMQAELQACLAALRCAQQMGISRVVVETDSMNLRDALTSDAFDLAPGGAFFSEARRNLALDFDVIVIRHCNRSCNSCAHELAHSSLGRDPDQETVWFDPLPSFVTSLLARDLAESEAI